MKIADGTSPPESEYVFAESVAEPIRHGKPCDQENPKSLTNQISDLRLCSRRLPGKEVAFGSDWTSRLQFER